MSYKFVCLAAILALMNGKALADATGANSTSALNENSKSHWTKEKEQRLQKLLSEKLSEAPQDMSPEMKALLANKPNAVASPANPAVAADAAAPASSSTKRDFLNLGQCPSAGPIFALRQNLKDLGGFAAASAQTASGAGDPQACPSPFDKANGAVFSYSDDRVAHNRVTTFQGLGAVLFNLPATYTVPPQDYHFAGESIGAYASINDISNTSTKKASANADTTTYGLVGLFTIAPPGEKGLYNDIRLSGGGVHDAIKNTDSANVTIAIDPTYTPLYINTPIFNSAADPVSFLFNPELLIQDDAASGAKNVLQFNGKTNSLRMGPQFLIGMYPNKQCAQFGCEDSPFGSALYRISLTFLYHPYYELYSRAYHYWTNTSLQYQLDDAGHFAISGSYQRGLDENTGASTNLYLVGLTGKI